METDDDGLGHGGIIGVLQTVQIVAHLNYCVALSPRVRHIPELLSITDKKNIHGDTNINIMMEMFGLL